MAGSRSPKPRPWPKRVATDRDSARRVAATTPFDRAFPWRLVRDLYGAEGWARVHPLYPDDVVQFVPEAGDERLILGVDCPEVFTLRTPAEAAAQRRPSSGLRRQARDWKRGELRAVESRAAA